MTTEAIAAEVAARYGIPVSPAVVQFVPRGTSGLPEYRWDGQGINPVVKAAPGEALGRKINAAWAANRKRQRLNAADRHQAEREARQARIAQSADERRRKQEGIEHAKQQAIQAKQQAEAEREERIRAFASNATLDAVAAFMGCSYRNAALYCNRRAIVFVARQKLPNEQAIKGRIARFTAAFANGDTVAQIAVSEGLTPKSVRNFAYKHEIAIPKAAHIRAPKPKGEKPSRVANPARRNAQRAIADARRAMVARLRSEGLSHREIAAKVGCAPSIVSTDLKALGITLKAKQRGALGSSAIVSRVLAMSARGMSYAEIAEAISLGKSSVHRIIKGAAA